MASNKEWRIFRSEPPAEVERLLERVSVSDQYPDRATVIRERERLLARIERRRHRRLILAAAVTVLLLCGGTGYWFWEGRTGTEPTPAVVYATGPGEILTLSLPDSSTVHLSANSRLVYAPPFARELSLTGHAFFDVTHDAARRFRVTTEHLTVEVLGTTFDVDDRTTDARVTLESGSLNVYPRRVRDTLQLVPGDEVVVADTQVKRRRVPQPEEREAHLSLRDRLFVFNDTPLTQVAAQIKEFYGVAIIFENNEIGQRRLSGRIRIRKVDELLVALEVLLDLRIDRTPEGILISSMK